MHIVILGRQAKIGLAELESIYGASSVQPLGPTAALVQVAPKNHKHLGSAVKIAKPLAELPFTDWHNITAHLLKELPRHIAQMPEGKIKLGLSTYGLNVPAKRLFATALELKKAARAIGRVVRIVPNTSPELNSAQVLHNKLTGDLGVELLCIRHRDTVWLAQTQSVQDVDAYAQRDYGRPKRDAFVGMLPPKLAQIMLNLAQVQPNQTVLDPFCGTGVVLQEALLAGNKIYGSDLSEKMIAYTTKNLSWLAQTHHITTVNPPLEVADATSHQWRLTPFDHAVCETYLGQPLSGLPRPEKLHEIIATCDIIAQKFLKNIRPQLKPGSRHCIAVPAWRLKNTFSHLPMLDHLENIGYNRMRFQHASWDELIYHREDQIVARELLVITVKE